MGYKKMQLLNPLTWLVTTREKILFCVAILLVGVATGWHIHSITDAYLNYSSVEKQLDRAKQAPAAISKFNQALRKTHVEKEPCYSVAIPADTLKLLR